MFDRLVSGAVFAETNGVVGPDKGDGNIHQRSKSNGTAHVITKDKEGASEWLSEAMKCDAIKDGSHCMFADTEVNDATVWVSAFHVTCGRKE